MAGLHIPQLFYFSVFTCILALPTTFPQLSRTLTALLVHHPFAFITTTSLFALAIKFTTIAHPFLLADNRHYPFYVWRRIINRTPWSRYALAPAYVVSMYIVFVRSWRRERFVSALAFVGACAAVLVPSPLIECRYYIVPYFVWRLRVAASEAVDENKEKKQEREVREWCELVWYLIINVCTIGLFLGKTFEWSQEPGVKQRFMW